jgi:hypothetical protein
MWENDIPEKKVQNKFSRKKGGRSGIARLFWFDRDES